MPQGTTPRYATCAFQANGCYGSTNAEIKPVGKKSSSDSTGNNDVAQQATVINRDTTPSPSTFEQMQQCIDGDITTAEQCSRTVLEPAYLTCIATRIPGNEWKAFSTSWWMESVAPAQVSCAKDFFDQCVSLMTSVPTIPRQVAKTSCQANCAKTAKAFVRLWSDTEGKVSPAVTQWYGKASIFCAGL